MWPRNDYRSDDIFEGYGEDPDISPIQWHTRTATNDILLWLMNEFKESNGLEFCGIDVRIKLARMLLNPAVKDCLDTDKAIPACGVAAYRMLGGE